MASLVNYVTSAARPLASWSGRYSPPKYLLCGSELNFAAHDAKKMAAAGGAFDHLSGGRLDIGKVRKIATNRIAKALSGLDGKKVRALSCYAAAREYNSRVDTK